MTNLADLPLNQANLLVAELFIERLDNIINTLDLERIKIKSIKEELQQLL